MKSIAKLMTDNREVDSVHKQVNSVHMGSDLGHKNELRAVYRFIKQASIEELALIISEIRACHDNVLVFNEERHSLDKVSSVSINGECIQLNLEQ